MPRTREFNKDDVIVRAMRLFWKHGYEGTSIRDLIDAMGISSSSMYEVFRDKRGVFLAALAYFCEQERARIAQMAYDASTPEAFIRQLFGTVDQVSQAQNTSLSGSMAFNAMVEFGTRDPDVTQLLLAHYVGIAQIVADVIRRGQAQGSVTSAADPLHLAYTMLTALHGVATVKGAQPNFQYASAITDTIVKLLYL